MGISFTGLSYLFAFFATGFLSYRFFRYWRRVKDKISKLSFYFTVPLVVFVFIKAVAGLFFAHNETVLLYTVWAAPFLQGLASAIGLYLIIYRKKPGLIPWLGFIPVLIMTVIVTYQTVQMPFSPFLDKDFVINWGYTEEFSLSYKLLRFLVILIGFLPLGIVSLGDYKKNLSPTYKTRTMGIVLICFLVMLIGFIDLVIPHTLESEGILREFFLGILSIIIFSTIFRPQKGLSEEE